MSGRVNGVVMLHSQHVRRDSGVPQCCRQNSRVGWLERPVLSEPDGSCRRIVLQIRELKRECDDNCKLEGRAAPLGLLAFQKSKNAVHFIIEFTLSDAVKQYLELDGQLGVWRFPDDNERMKLEML